MITNNDLETNPDAPAGDSFPIDDYQLSLFSTLVAALGGYDLKVVPRYAGPDADHERRKLVRMGASVLIPAVMSFFATYFFAGGYTTSVEPRVLAAIGVSVLVLILDCIIVSTLVKNGSFGTAVRLFISICMSTVISEPLVVALNPKTIETYLVETLGAKVVAEQTAYNQELAKLEASAVTLNSSIAKDQTLLTGFSPHVIALKHFNEQRAHRDGVVVRIQADKDREVTRLNTTKADLQRQEDEIQKAIEARLIDMDRENAGQRDSGKAGKGTVYHHLEDQVAALRVQRQQLVERMSTLDRRIDSVLADKTAEAKVDSELAIDAPDASSIAELEPDEQAQKDRLDAEITRYKNSLAVISAQQAQVVRNLEGLQEKYALSRHNDSLAQTRALYEILQQNYFLRLKVGAMFLLLFLLDVSPVLIKLTARTGYDEYLASLARKRAIKGAAEFDEFHDSVVKSAQRRVENLSQFCTTTLDKLRRNHPDGRECQYAKSIRIKIERETERYADEMMAQARNVFPEDRQSGALGTVWSALSRGVWLLKIRLGT